MGSYGTATWGGLSVATAITQAYAVGPKLVLVEFDNAPSAVSPFVVGDVLNPLTWHVTNLGTSIPLLVCGVTKQTSTRFRVQVANLLGGPGVLHRIAASDVRSISGVLLVAPRYADFYGIHTDASAFPISKRRPSDLRGTPSNGANVGAGLVIGANGDYARESGPALARKLIVRRLTTPAGAFLQWKTFGFDLSAKNFYNPSALIQLRAEIIRELSKEADFSDIRVTLVLRSNSVLEVSVSVRIPSYTQQVQVTFPVSGVQVR